MSSSPVPSPSRRQFLALGGLVAGGLALGALRPVRALGETSLAGTDPWALADQIVYTTVRPQFPARYFDVTDYGAVGDGQFDCTDAFRAAIEACANSSGGHVIVPPGRYLSGAIHLLSRVDLHLQAGATIAFSTDPAAFMPVVLTRVGGIECMNYSPAIYAYQQHDIAITGEGTLDGQADNQHWWPWAAKTEFGWQPGQPNGNADGDLLIQMANQGVPVSERVFGTGHYVRPSFVQPYQCQNVLISGITTTNTPNWQLHPVLCKNVTIEHVTTNSLGPNNDGCDPESCDHVVIDNVTFNTGDDCIAIKAGKDVDGRRVNVPCQNIVVQNTEFLQGHGALTIGSEMSGGVRNVFVRDCRSDSLALNQFLRLKTNSARGGFIEEVYLRNVKAERLGDAGVSIDFYYGGGPGQGFNPTVRGIHVERMFVGTTVYPVYLSGYSDDHIGDVTLTDCLFEHASRSSSARNVDNLVFDNVYVNDVLATPPKPFANLAAAFDNSAIGTATAPGDYDGGGRYYTADSLAAAGLTPGATVTVNGHAFTWPNADPGQPDNVACSSQVVLLSGTGSTLGYLGSGTHGNQSGTAFVTYTDGSSDTVTFALTDWWTNQALVGDVLAASAVTNGGRRVGVYYNSVPLSPGKTVQSIELPSNSNLHVFAVSIG